MTSKKKRYFIPGGDSSNTSGLHSKSEANETVQPDRSGKSIARDDKAMQDVKDDTEALLEQLVFGSQDNFVKTLTETRKEHEQTPRDNASSVGKERKPVWHDDDDDDSDDDNDGGAIGIKKKRQLTTHELENKLRDKFMKISGGEPSWANVSKLGGGGDVEDSNPLLTHTGAYSKSSAGVRHSHLPAGTIDVVQCKDANHSLPSDSRVTSVEFHPTAQVITTAGYNHRLTLFQVDGKENPKIESIYFDKFPITKARMINNADEIVLGSPLAKHFYTYDLMSGKVTKVPKIMHIRDSINHMGNFSVGLNMIAFHGNNGTIHLVSTKSKEYINTLRMPSDINCSTFANTCDKFLYAAGREGLVYVWDVRRTDCVYKMYDEGCLEVTSITLSHDDNYLAVGSNTGVVNVYNRSGLRYPVGKARGGRKSRGGVDNQAKPLKAITNLITPVTHACFNPTSEILALASEHKNNAVKFIQLPSLTAFANFPLYKDWQIKAPLSQHFSASSGYYAVSNYGGRVLLYRLQYYTSY